MKAMKNEKLRHVYDCPTVVAVQLVSERATMLTGSEEYGAPMHVESVEEIF